MTRREERELTLGLLFEWGYDRARAADEIYETAVQHREIPENDYARRILSGVCEHAEELDAVIDEHAKGWKRNRISRVSLAVMYIAAYEMLYCEDIPVRVSLNEAIELSKLYDDDNAYTFVNGVLHGISRKAEEKRG